MRKSTRLIKRLVALFLVVLLSCESFAALVSDNDGAAFITKAEFDSLKNNFQAQIDQYNTSIDNKIDGAIASYLAGVKVAKREEKHLLFNNGTEVESLKIAGEGRIKYVYGNPTIEARCEYDYVSFYDVTSTNRYKKVVRWDQRLYGEPIHKLLIKKLDKNRRLAEWDGYTTDAYENYTGYDVNVNLSKSGTPVQTLEHSFNGQYTYWFQNNTVEQGTKIGQLDQLYANSSSITQNVILRGRSLTFGSIFKQNAIIWEPIPYDRFNVSDGQDIGFGNRNAYDDYGADPNTATQIKIKNFVTSVKNYVLGAPVSTVESKQMFEQNDADFIFVTNQDDPVLISLPHVWPGDRWADRWITNWNQLYTSRFGRQTDAILENGYLYLYNGLPLVMVKAGDIVNWTFNIKEAGTYIMIAGTKPFNEDNTNVEPIKISIDHGKFKNVAEFTGGIDHTFSLDFEKINTINDALNRTVYIKWTEKDKNGGGTLDLAEKYKTVYVTNNG